MVDSRARFTHCNFSWRRLVYKTRCWDWQRDRRNPPVLNAACALSSSSEVLPSASSTSEESMARKNHSPSAPSLSLPPQPPAACLPPPPRIVCPVPRRRRSSAPGGNRWRRTHAEALLVLVFSVSLVDVVSRRCPRCRGPGRQGADPCPGETPRLHASAPGVHRRVQHVSFRGTGPSFLLFLFSPLSTKRSKSGQRSSLSHPPTSFPLLPLPPPNPPLRKKNAAATSASTSTTRPAPRSSPASPPTTRTRPSAPSSARPSTTPRACRTFWSTRCSAARASTRSRSRSSS